jgi:hypothetical protein
MPEEAMVIGQICGNSNYNNSPTNANWITVCHFPPGTSKWNKIEHRLFSFITKNWRGRPLLDMVTVVNLISNTKTKQGLKVHSVVDKNKYEIGIKATNKELKNLNIKNHKFHLTWNYTIKKSKQKI